MQTCPESVSQILGLIEFTSTVQRGLERFLKYAADESYVGKSSPIEFLIWLYAAPNTACSVGDVAEENDNNLEFSYTIEISSYYYFYM